MKRPDMDQIHKQFEIVERPSAKLSKEMFEYILDLEKHKVNDRKYKNQLKSKIKKLQKQKCKLKDNVKVLETDLWICKETNTNY
jgi:hypothetical protein